MTENLHELRFVAVNKSGHTLNPEEERARRSHVRRAISRSKRNLPLFERLKFVHHTESSKKRASQKESVRKKLRGSTSQPWTQDLPAEPAPSVMTSSKAEGLATATGSTSNELREVTRLGSLQTPLTVSHPLTIFASKHAHLSPVRIDTVFKSDAFRTASEPLFDSSHVDATLNMHTVFPGCADEPVFLNALVYATVQIFNRGVVSTEGLLLKGKTIKLLNERLGNPKPLLTPPVIGAIMILKSVAYKFPDLGAHRTHTLGLNRVINMSSTNDISLTAAAKRAIFWLDLFAAMLVGSKRQLSHTTLPPVTCWRREQFPDSAIPLPLGFVRYRNWLPRRILDCIADTIELQSLLSLSIISNLPHHAKYHQLDTMQASIESRLAFEEYTCQEHGPVAETVRLGVFVVCYCSWMETWNSSLIPCRMAEKLLEMMESFVTSTNDDLQNPRAQQMDIFFWLLLVLSNVAQLDQGHAINLQSRTCHLIRSAKDSLFLWLSIGIHLRDELHKGLNDFIYCVDWQAKRHNLKPWFELELSIMSIQ